MTDKMKKQREENIKRLKEKYEQEIKSCLDEAEEYAKKHPLAEKCVIRRKKTSDEFKAVLYEVCLENDMVVHFGWMGRIEIWFDIIQYMANGDC